MLGRLLESRAVRDPAWGRWARGDDFAPASDTGGQRVTQSSAMGLLAVHGCVQLISDAIATLPVDVLGSAGAPPRWVEQPNPDMDRVDLIASTVTSLLLDGNAFLAVLRDASNRPTELMLLDPTKVSVERRDGRVAVRVDGRIYGGEVLVVRGLLMPGEIRGVSPVEALSLIHI